MMIRIVNPFHQVPMGNLELCVAIRRAPPDYPLFLRWRQIFVDPILESSQGLWEPIGVGV